MSQLNDAQLVGMLSKLLHYKGDADTPEKVLDAVHFDGRIALPFALDEVRVIRDRYSLRALIVDPKPSSEFITRLDETPGQVCLASDRNLSGQDALYFCVSGDLSWVQRVEPWLRRQAQPGLVCGSRSNHFYIAAPVKRFTN